MPILFTNEESNYKIEHPAHTLLLNMKYCVNLHPARICLGDTGPNRAGLFARVSPCNLLAKYVLG